MATANTKRRGAALKAIQAHDVSRNGTRGQRSALNGAVGRNDVLAVEKQAALVDLLTDLMHLANDRPFLDFNAAVESARRHHAVEVK